MTDNGVLAPLKTWSHLAGRLKDIVTERLLMAAAARVPMPCRVNESTAPDDG